MIVAPTPGEELAEAAAALIGTRFRLHGRDADSGLDCVGLVHASLLAIGRESAPPQGYRLRNSDTGCWQEFAELSGLQPVCGPITTGDVLMLCPGPGQHHIAIAECPKVAIHAHAGLRRVVRQPMAFPQYPIAHWRLT